ncbi:MAG: hypothetical protein ACTH31_08380 [Pseudoclavibacter sp.]
MQGKGVGQDDFGGYRFQLAYMTYALALVHRNRLDAAPGYVKPIMERLMGKMLDAEVWSYWHDVSRGGSVYNAHLGPGEEQWDPVANDNIMYSAYVQSMASLHHYLFRDARYEEPGSLTFEHWSFFWGGEPRRFEYDAGSLDDLIYWQMVQSGFLGVACEPNCIFQICNQPAILGFRMRDLATGSDRATEVVREYEAAWEQVGRLDERGHYVSLISRDSGRRFENETLMPWVDGWLGTLMNMWNRDVVRQQYPRQVRDLITTDPDGSISVSPTGPRAVMGQKLNYDWGDFGWVATWASEMGDAETLNGLLEHADAHMAPRWDDGALHYPRNDAERDPLGNLTLVDPIAGNVLLGYARLNVPDGLWTLYNTPWPESHWADPAIVEIDPTLDLRQAHYDEVTATLTIETFGVRSGAHLTIAHLPERGWTIHCDGHVCKPGHGGPVGVELLQPGEVRLTFETDTDLVITIQSSGDDL